MSESELKPEKPFHVLKRIFTKEKETPNKKTD